MIIETVNQIQPSDELALQDRGALFGDGFFTTGIIEAGQLKHRLLHLNRLSEAAQRFGFKGFEAAKLEAELSNVALAVQKATVRITLSRLQSQRGYATRDAQSVKLAILLSPWVAAPTVPCKAFYAQTPVSVNPALAGYKHLNRLDNVLAASECSEVNQEALMCHNNQVICGSRSNLFVYHQQKWLTPKLEMAGIKGLTRQRLIAAALQRGITISESEVTKSMLESCQAAFLTNCILGLWPIAQIGNISLDTQICHDLQSQLNFSR